MDGCGYSWNDPLVALDYTKIVGITLMSCRNKNGWNGPPFLYKNFTKMAGCPLCQYLEYKPVLKFFLHITVLFEATFTSFFKDKKS
jgi:hypothetical protein